MVISLRLETFPSPRDDTRVPPSASDFGRAGARLDGYRLVAVCEQMSKEALPMFYLEI